MVLVTGATGILGRVITLELVKRGKKVRAARRPASNLAEVRNSFQFYTENPDFYFDQIQWAEVDISDFQSYRQALIGIEEVYHCAAFVSFDPADAEAMYKTNIEGTKSLLYACENSSVKKFCHVSSIAVMDEKNEQGEIDESAAFNPKISHSGYAVSKQFAEMEAWRAAAEGLNVLIINPGIIIGSGNWSRSSGTLFKTFEDSPYTFSGGSSYVDVRDVAKIAIDLMEKNIFGERYILVSETLPYKTVAQKIRKSLGLGAPKILSRDILRAGKFLNRLTFGLIPGLRMANTPNLEAVLSQNKISNRKIKEATGYHFIPIGESIDFHLKNYIADKKRMPNV